MRLRRLTETKSTGKTWVDEKTQADYKAGGERREWLEIALLEALKKHGTGRDAYKRVKVCIWGSAKNCAGVSKIFVYTFWGHQSSMDQILHQVLQTFFWPRYTINQTVQSIHIYNYIYMHCGDTKRETQLYVLYSCPGRVLDSCSGGARKDAVQGAGNHRQVVDGREDEGWVWQVSLMGNVPYYDCWLKHGFMCVYISIYIFMIFICIYKYNIYTWLCWMLSHIYLNIHI